jgi:hypothetical protein
MIFRSVRRFTGDDTPNYAPCAPRNHHVASGSNLNSRTEASFISQMVVANEAALELYLRHAPFDILLFSLKDNLSFRTVPLTSVMNSRRLIATPRLKIRDRSNPLCIEFRKH